MNNLFSTLDANIKSLSASDPNCQYTFKDYYIKTAYNSCSAGTTIRDFVNVCALKDILKQGIRGLDFEIYSVGQQPVVSTSILDSYFVKETYNSVLFSDVMNIINTYAFSSSTAPNPLDPIIFHLRFMSSNQTMYQNLANLFQQYDTLFLDSSYSFESNGTNFGNTPLLELMGKIIVIVDKASNNAFMDCPDFFEYVNLTSNSIFMRALEYTSGIQNTPDLIELQDYNKLNMTISLPDNVATPVNPSAIVCRETGAQMIAMCYQVNDVNLQENNAFFDSSGYAFALKPANLRYEVTDISNAVPQDVALSYGTRQVSSNYYAFNI